MSIVVDNALEMVELFTGVATASLLSAALLAIGSLLIGFSMAVFGGLTLGSLLSPLTPGKY
jgi:hypothetical protein